MSEPTWKGYGSPNHPWTFRRKPDCLRSPLCVIPNMAGYYDHERHAALAEARLEREGVLVELVAYVAGIGKEVGRG